MCRTGPGGSVRRMASTTLARSTSSGWLGATSAQLLCFCTVGASGYLVNCATFYVAARTVGIDYRLASVIAFGAAVGNNFAWNRCWTFRASGRPAQRQAARYLALSIAVLALTLTLLDVLVAALHVPSVAAEALATAASTPLGFLGSRWWAFGDHPPIPLTRGADDVPDRH
jgi:putative flippase GtrA